MLSRGGASNGVVGSAKALCGANLARPSVFEIEALQQQYLLGRHLRHVEPPMLGAEFDRIGFTDAVRIDQVGRDKLARLHRAGIADRQREIEQRFLDRPPQVDDLHPAFQEFIGLVGKKIADAMRA